jgi:hypothetical protein
MCVCHGKIDPYEELFPCIKYQSYLNIKYFILSLFSVFLRPSSSWSPATMVLAIPTPGFPH